MVEVVRCFGFGREGWRVVGVEVVRLGLDQDVRLAAGSVMRSRCSGGIGSKCCWSRDSLSPSCDQGTVEASSKLGFGTVEAWLRCGGDVV